MNELSNILNTDVTFNTMEDYYWHVFISLYKTGILQSAKYSYYLSYDNNNNNDNDKDKGYGFSFNGTDEPSERHSWFLKNYEIFKKMLLNINNSHISTNNELLLDTPISKYYSGYKTFSEDYNKSMDKVLKTLLPNGRKLYIDSYIDSRRFPVEFIQTLTICSFYQQENFVKVFFKELSSGHISLFQAQVYIKKLEQLCSLLEVENNPFLDNLLKNKFIKQISIDTLNINTDARSSLILNFINNLDQKHQDIYYQYLLKKTTEKEKLCLKKFIELPNFSNTYLNQYKKALESFSIDKSVDSLNEPTKLLADSLLFEKQRYFFSIILPMEKVYAFYKKIYLKQNFPLNQKKNLIIKLKIDKFDLNISLEISPTKNLEINFINLFDYTNSIEAHEFNQKFKDKLIYFVDKLIIQSHKVLLEENTQFLYSENPQLSIELGNFIKEIRENELLKKITIKDEDNNIQSSKKKI